MCMPTYNIQNRVRQNNNKTPVALPTNYTHSAKAAPAGSDTLRTPFPFQHFGIPSLTVGSLSVTANGDLTQHLLPGAQHCDSLGGCLI